MLLKYFYHVNPLYGPMCPTELVIVLCTTDAQILSHINQYLLRKCIQDLEVYFYPVILNFHIVYIAVIGHVIRICL